MRVGHYMHDLWSPGGVATYLKRVTSAQLGRGHEIVFFDSSAAPSAAVAVRDGVALAEAARERSVDVLHLHIGPPGGFAGGVPAVRTVHGHHPYCPSGTQYLARRGTACHRTSALVGCTWGHLVDRCGSIRPRRVAEAIRRTLAEHRVPPAMPMIAISQFGRDRLIRDGFDPERVKVFMNPAPPIAAVEPLGDDPRFVYLGRMVPLKGLAWLLDAAGTSGRRWHLDVAGTGDSETAMQSLARRRGLDHRVTFHGWLDDAAVADLLRSAWAVVVPSLWHEPAGMSAIEAGAFGRAVVVSDTGGLPEVVEDGVTGMVVRAGDVGGLARALDRLSGDRAGATAMGRAGAERVARHHALGDHVEALERVYREAMAG